MTIQTRSAIVQLVDIENKDGTVTPSHIGRLEFKADRAGELIELFYYIGTIIGEIEQSGDGSTGEAQPEDAQPEDIAPAPVETPIEGEIRRRRTRRTKEQMAAARAESEQPAMSNGQSEIVAQPEPPVAAAPVPLSAPVVAAAPDASITPKMIAATKPREVVQELFAQDKDAGREPRKPSDIVKFIKLHRPEIPCIAAMGDDYETRLESIAATIHSALTI